MEITMSKNKKLKIGWQKYEDLVEQQLSAPLLKTLTSALSQEISNEYETDEDYEDEEENGPMIVPFSAKLLDDVAISSNFDCWVGHTNFDITKEIKQKLDTTEGIEVLKICSRYRFFIGVGQMFDFKEVRKSIENSLIKE